MVYSKGDPRKSFLNITSGVLNYSTLCLTVLRLLRIIMLHFIVESTVGSNFQGAECQPYLACDLGTVVAHKR